MAPNGRPHRARDASRSSAPSRAARRRCSKRSWSAPARSSVGPRRRTATASAMQAPRRAAMRMSVEPNVATVDFLGETLSPSSIAPARSNSCTTCAPSLPACDAAVVVCEADERKIPALRAGAARTRGSRTSRASSSSTRSTRRRGACARRWRCCSAPRARRCCCGRSRSGRTASPSASSTSRSSAPSSIGSMRRARSCDCPTASCRARARRASPCSSGSPITTTR